MANAALEVIARQSWWLSQRSIPLALFSRSADDDALSELAAAMVMAKPNGDAPAVEPGKPAFPSLKKGLALKDFVGAESWVFFDRLGDKGEWLIKEPSEWAADPAYIASENIARALHGVSDIAERGVRMADFYKVNSIHFVVP